jgi:DMSO/TMAO reductase YedYZ molybdopterin-dependent catalytic subunit
MDNLPPTESPDKSGSALENKIKRRNFISFATLFIAGGAAYGGWQWLYHSPKETPGITAGAHKPLRVALNKTELFFRQFFSNQNLVKTYPIARAAKKVNVNGHLGLRDPDFTLDNWRLVVNKTETEQLQITIADIKALPKTELIFSFKCVEGWDQIQHWGGVRFIDFISHYHLEPQAALAYVGLETPDKKYYVGLDRESAFHPQTILAYEMNNLPITEAHGAPLRLIIPVKYGIKNLKRIGMITFSNTRPRDYWAKQGYDYYSGL